MPDEPSSLDAQFAAADKLIEQAQRHLPRSAEPQAAASPPKPALRCPACGGELQPGLASVHGTFWGFLLVGFSHQNCWFEPDGGGAEVVVIPSGGAKDGWRCQGCGFVGIAGGEARQEKRRIGDA